MPEPHVMNYVERESTEPYNFFGLPRKTCAAFTGYRPAKFDLIFRDGNGERRVRELLSPVLIHLYEAGVRIFLSGMAEGFDTWAALEVLRLRDEGKCPEAGVAAVVPYAGQSSCYGEVSFAAYERILKECRFRTVLYPHYFPECFHRRNDFLVDNSSVVVCYYDGRKGGTGYTVGRARRAGIPVINLSAHDLFLL